MLCEPNSTEKLRLCAQYHNLPVLMNRFRLIPKLFLRLLWLFRRTAALFRQIRTFPRLCRFGSDLGNHGIRQIVRNSMLSGGRWDGRILINLCGNNNVRNCDLLQSDFSDRCRTVLGVAKGFVWYVVRFCTVVATLCKFHKK